MFQSLSVNALTTSNIGSLSEQNHVCLEREALGIEGSAYSDSRWANVQLHFFKIKEISRRFRNLNTNDVTSEVGHVGNIELLNLGV